MKRVSAIPTAIVNAMAAACVLTSGAAWAQSTPVGLWRSIDDQTGEVKAEIRIGESSSGLSGRIERTLGKDAKEGSLCEQCSDERRGAPMVGLEIIRGAKKVEGADVWEGGKILDPDNGREYRLRLTPIEGGEKLDVRGSFGPFARTQTWERAR